MMLFFRIFFSISREPASRAALILAFIVVNFAETRSEESHTDSHMITLSIRTIQASEPRLFETLQASAGQQIHLEGNIRDLERKLAQLPFNTFQLIDSKEETIALKTRDSLQLPNGQSLTFRPMYIDTKKVGLWLHWRNQEGGEILNTRVHFDTDDSVVTGTDCAHDKGVILAIKAVIGR